MVSTTAPEKLWARQILWCRKRLRIPVRHITTSLVLAEDMCCLCCCKWNQIIPTNPKWGDSEISSCPGGRWVYTLGCLCWAWHNPKGFSWTNMTQCDGVGRRVKKRQFWRDIIIESSLYTLLELKAENLKTEN